MTASDEDHGSLEADEALLAEYLGGEIDLDHGEALALASRLGMTAAELDGLVEIAGACEDDGLGRGVADVSEPALEERALEAFESLRDAHGMNTPMGASPSGSVGHSAAPPIDRSANHTLRLVGVSAALAAAAVLMFVLLGGGGSNQGNGPKDDGGGSSEYLGRGTEVAGPLTLQDDGSLKPNLGLRSSERVSVRLQSLGSDGSWIDLTEMTRVRAVVFPPGVVDEARSLGRELRILVKVHGTGVALPEKSIPVLPR